MSTSFESESFESPKIRDGDRCVLALAARIDRHYDWLKFMAQLREDKRQARLQKREAEESFATKTEEPAA